MTTNGCVQISVKSYEDLIHRVMSFESFRVADRVYSADLLIPQLVIDNKDLLTEGAMTAAFVLHWGREAARARRYHARAEAAYRSWRDGIWIALKSTPLGAEDKPKFPSDAMTDKLVRQDPQYGHWRGRLDDSQESAEVAEAVLEAFRVKAELIKNQQRLLRDEAGGPYHLVEEPRETVPRQPQLSY